MSDTPFPPLSSPAAAPLAAPVPAPSLAPQPWRWVYRAGGLAAVLALLASLGLTWVSQARLSTVEQTLARRQQDDQNSVDETRLLAKTAQDSARESAAKVALLEARLAEVALQRSQLEELIQSLSRARDENVVVDIEAGLRVAQQQAAITGSAEPLVAALKQADERLARYRQPRLDGVRRAIARDLDRVKAVGVADLSALGIKLDETTRLVDELPMLAQATARKGAVAPGLAAATSKAPAQAGGWWQSVKNDWESGAAQVWDEVRSLVRVTRIDHPDAALLAPEQAYFVRENLKLRLLNARLALLSRQFDTAQSDLHAAQAMLERYFDHNSRRTGVASDLVRQVAAAARQVNLPRPDDSLAALAAAAAGR